MQWQTSGKLVANQWQTSGKPNGKPPGSRREVVLARVFQPKLIEGFIYIVFLHISAHSRCLARGLPLGLPLVCHWFAISLPLVCHCILHRPQLNSRSLRTPLFCGRLLDEVQAPQGHPRRTNWKVSVWPSGPETLLGFGFSPRK